VPLVNWRESSGSTGSSTLPARVLVFVSVSYVFWILALPLLNPRLLLVAPIWPISLPIFWKFLPFLLPPLALGLLTSAAAAMWSRQREARGTVAVAVFFNLVLGMSTLLYCEVYKSLLIYIEAKRLGAECVHKHWFIRSIRDGGEHAPEHAHLVKGGKTYFWSYSERRFVPSDGYQTRGCP